MGIGHGVRAQKQASREDVATALPSARDKVAQTSRPMDMRAVGDGQLLG